MSARHFLDTNILLYSISSAPDAEARMTPVILFENAWEGDDEAALTNWFFDDGAAVAEGDLIAEVMVSKAAIEIRAPVGGRLTIRVPIDAVVAKGDTLAEIE